MLDNVYINGIGLIHPSGAQNALMAAFAGNMAEEEQSRPQLSDLLPGASLRRVPKAARLALHASVLALMDAGIEVPLSGDYPIRTGVFTGSAHGAVEGGFDFMDSIIKYGAHLASPTAFSYSVNNVFTGMLSLYLGAQGPSFTSGQFGVSFAGALQAAASSLLQGGCDCALLCAAEDTSDFLKLIYQKNWFADWEQCPPEPPLEQCALCLVLQRERKAGSVRISFPVWDARAAASEDKDALFASAKCKKISAGPAPCLVDCHALYGNTSAVHALDVAMAALSLRGGLAPAAVWCAEGAPAGLFSRVACELYDPLTHAYASITLAK